MADHTKRLALVVASQCEKLPSKVLSFVAPLTGNGDYEPVAETLASVLFDYAKGAFLPAVSLDPDLRGVVVNPSKDEARNALEQAYRSATESGSVLLVHFLGHAFGSADRHLLQVRDSEAEPASGNQAWDIYHDLEELRNERQLRAGLMLVIDACWGSSAEGQIRAWTNPGGDAPWAWMSSSTNAPAFDGCLTKTMSDALTSGIAGTSAPTIGLTDFSTFAETKCGRPMRLRTDASGRRAGQLHLGTNIDFTRQMDRLGLDRAAAERLRVLKARFIDTGVTGVWEQSRGHRVSTIVANAGEGKSAYAAILRDPPPTIAGRADAVAFVERYSTADEISTVLGSQLSKIPKFDHTYRSLHAQYGDGWEALPGLDRWLVRTCREYREPLVVLVDGLDQLDPGRRDEIDALVRATTDTPNLRLMFTSRPEGPIPDGSHRIALPSPSSAAIREFLGPEDLDEEAVKRLLEAANGNWLTLHLGLASLRDGLGDLDPAHMYGSLLARTFETHDTTHASALLAVLAATGSAAGPGAFLPVPLLLRAAARLSPGFERSELYEMLAGPLHQIVEAPNLGAPNERVGLFHTSAIDAVSLQVEDIVIDAHSAIVDSLIEFDDATDDA